MNLPFPDLTALVVSAFGAAASFGVRKAIETKLRKDCEMIAEEIRLGLRNRHDIPPESLAAPIYCLMRKSIEGAARVNLRILSRLMAGQASAGELVPSEFLYWVNAIGDLRYEELVLIKLMAKGATSNDVVPAAFPSNDYVVALAQSISRT